jgi:hypothetical protein
VYIPVDVVEQMKDPDNESFVVESYLDEPAQIHALNRGSSRHLKNLTTCEVVEGKTQAMLGSPRADRPPHTEFKFDLTPHSLVAFVERNALGVHPFAKLALRRLFDEMQRQERH